MKRFHLLIGAALAALLSAGTSVRADLVAWTYNWTPTTTSVSSDSGNSKITLTNEPLGNAVGSSDIVATNLKVTSSANPNHPDTFTHKGYGLDLTLFDTASHTSGTLHFTGEFNGTVSSASSLITNTYTGLVSQSITLGSSVYTVTMGNFTPPAPPGAQNYGSISAVAIVSVNPVQHNPEPSTLVLGGLGLVGAGLGGWVRRRGKAPAGGAV